VEIRRLAVDPRQEAGNLGMHAQARGVARAGELGIREIRMDRAVTDRVDCDGLAPAAAFRPGMVPLDTAPERAPAQPTGCRLGQPIFPMAANTPSLRSILADGGEQSSQFRSTIRPVR
jgi:hypothetical protein